MQSQKRIFDDIAKVAGGALGALGSLKQEIEVLVRQRVERFLADRDFVTREEFEAVKAMASEARAEQVRLLTRLETLEGASPKTTGSASDQASPRKSLAKKTARKIARKPAAKT
jgi:BMFP domain-containing protein YqiC